MKLRKQPLAKAGIVALTAGLFVGFFALIRAEPRIQAQEEAPPAPAVDYRRFFQPSAPPQASEPSSPQRHTRTRAS
jgi:hypothetical protein